MYVQERPEESTNETARTVQILMPNYQEIVSPVEVVGLWSTRKHIVVLSSFIFANNLLKTLTSELVTSTNLLSPVYSILLGSFWGDPRQATRVEKETTLLRQVKEIDEFYALRNNINGIRRFQEHMSSIQLHSPCFKNNKFIQRYWENVNLCSLDGSSGTQCMDDNPFFVSDVPILRNYKSVLILDAAAIVAKYIHDYHNQTDNNSSNLSKDGLFGFLERNVLEVENEWTGNQWLFGIPAGNGRSFEWVQPMEWTYEIMQLRVDKKTFTGDVYGTWSIRLNRTSSQHTRLLKLNSSDLLSDLETSCVLITSCTSIDLSSMTALVVIIAVLLSIFVLLIVLKNRGRSEFRAAIKSPGVVIMGCVALLSIIVSLVTIFGDKVGDCDDHLNDFLVTLTNSVCFTVLLIAVVVPLVTSRLLRLLVKVIGFVFVMMIQLAVSIQAHLVEGGETKHDDDPVTHCYNERGKVLSSVSYLYGNVLLVLCVLLLNYNLCSERGEYYQSNGAFKLISGLFTVLLTITYTVLVTVLLWIESVSSCVVMGRILTVLAIFPAMICLVIVAVVLLSDSNDSQDIDCQSDDIKRM